MSHDGLLLGAAATLPTMSTMSTMSTPATTATTATTAQTTRTPFHISAYGTEQRLNNSRPQTSIPTQYRSSTKHLNVIRPSSAAFFWGDSGSPESGRTKQKAMSLTMKDRISQPIFLNQGKYIVPKTTKTKTTGVPSTTAIKTTPPPSKRPSQSSNKKRTKKKKQDVQEQAPDLARTRSVHQVIEIVERNELNVQNDPWSSILYELKALCIERNINTSTRGLYNPKDKAITLRGRIMDTVATEKKNMIHTIRHKADLLSGRTARTKIKLGMALTAYEKSTLDGTLELERKKRKLRKRKNANI